MLAERRSGGPSPAPPPTSPATDVTMSSGGAAATTGRVGGEGGAGGTERVMSRVEEAVSRLYQKRVHEAQSAAAELDTLQRQVANQIRRTELDMSKIGEPFEEAQKRESARRDELIQEIEARYRTVCEGINRAKAAAQARPSAHFKDLTAANESIRTVQASLTSGLDEDTVDHKAFIEGYRPLMDRVAAALEQGRRCTTEDSLGGGDALHHHLDALRRLTEAEGLSRVTVREASMPCVGGGHPVNGEPLHQSIESREQLRSSSRRRRRAADGHDRSHGRHGRSNGHGRETEKGHHSSGRRARDVEKLAAEGKIKDEIIRDLLQSYEELEELYRVATLQQKAVESGLLPDTTLSSGGGRPVARTASQHAANTSASSLSRRVSQGLLKLSASSTRQSRDSSKRRPAAPLSSSTSTSSSIASLPSNPEVAEVLGQAISPNPLTYSSSPSPIQRPRMDPDPCPPPDRFNQLLRKLQHVEHMLGDVSSSDGSPVKSRRASRGAHRSPSALGGAAVGGLDTNSSRVPSPEAPGASCSAIEDRLEQIQALLAQV